MKFSLLLLAVVVLLSGCATSTIESRKKQRYQAYSELTPEQRAAVDAGQIKVGLPMDAVFVAWGKPQQVVYGESPAGAQTVWLYTDTYLQGYNYWGYQSHYGGYRRYHSPVLRYDYVPVGYVKAEVVFEQGVVKQWRSFPAPGF